MLPAIQECHLLVPQNVAHVSSPRRFCEPPQSITCRTRGSAALRISSHRGAYEQTWVHRICTGV